MLVRTVTPLFERCMDCWAIREKPCRLLGHAGSTVTCRDSHAKHALVASGKLHIGQRKQLLYTWLLPRRRGPRMLTQEQPTVLGLKLVDLADELQVFKPLCQGLGVLLRTRTQVLQRREGLALWRAYDQERTFRSSSAPRLASVRLGCLGPNRI